MYTVVHNVNLGNRWSHSDALSPARFPHPRSERHRPLPLGERRVKQQLHAGRHARPRPRRGHHRGSHDAGVSHRAAEHPRVGAAPSAAGEYITASRGEAICETGLARTSEEILVCCRFSSRVAAGPTRPR